MSANTRLSRLKRGPLINDVSSQEEVPSTNTQENRNMVQPMTILTWHEQRINNFEKNVKELTTKLEQNTDDLILPLIETIQVLEKKVDALTHALDALTTVKRDGKRKKTLKDGINKLKLDVSKELQGENVELVVKEKLIN